MPRERKRREVKEKLEKYEENTNNLNEKISYCLQGLFYISETDAEVLLFNGQKADSVNKESLLSQLEKTDDIKVEEVGFEDFFKPIIKLQDWFGEEERKMTESFSKLKNLLQENLRDLKVYKIGKKNIDIYVVGLDSENILRGIQTKAVET